MKQINILVPIAGKSKFFDENSIPFPKPLIEIKGLPMIQHTIKYLDGLKSKNFIFVIRETDAQKFHIDETLKLLTDNKAVIIKQNADTKGAACSCLLALESFDNDSELIISNGDQYLDIDLESVVNDFRKSNADAGVIYFHSVHPQWSYIKFDENNLVCEAAEKKPISRNAIAGFYYFKKGSDFGWAAQETIMKDIKVNDMFFIAPTLNELILKGKKVMGIQIDNNKFKSFYSPEKIREFERES